MLRRARRRRTLVRFSHRARRDSRAKPGPSRGLQVNLIAVARTYLSSTHDGDRTLPTVDESYLGAR
jgi:hypothetical protein